MKRGIIFGLLVLILVVSVFWGWSLLTPTAPTFLWSKGTYYTQTEKAIVAADVRLFTTMSIFNAVYDYDDETGEEFHPVRQTVRAALQERLANVSAKKIASWKKFYAKRDFHLYHYLHYTMSLSDQYPFKPVLQESDDLLTRIKSRFTGLHGFEKVMNEFWEIMELESLWQEVLPAYQAEMNRFDMDRIWKEEFMVWDYMRQKNPAPERYLVTLPNLLESENTVFSAEYPKYYFTIYSPGSFDYGLNIRQYLRNTLRTLVQKGLVEHEAKYSAYFEAAKANEYIKNHYKTTEDFVLENLVRAMEMRIQMVNSLDEPQNIYSQINPQTLQGFNLLLTFYHILQEYEDGRVINFEDYSPDLFYLVAPYKA